MQVMAKVDRALAGEVRFAGDVFELSPSDAKMMIARGWVAEVMTSVADDLDAETVAEHTKNTVEQIEASLESETDPEPVGSEVEIDTDPED